MNAELTTISDQLAHGVSRRIVELHRRRPVAAGPARGRRAHAAARAARRRGLRAAHRGGERRQPAHGARHRAGARAGDPRRRRRRPLHADASAAHRERAAGRRGRRARRALRVLGRGPDPRARPGRRAAGDADRRERRGAGVRAGAVGGDRRALRRGAGVAGVAARAAVALKESVARHDRRRAPAVRARRPGAGRGVAVARAARGRRPALPQPHDARRHAARLHHRAHAHACRWRPPARTTDRPGSSSPTGTACSNARRPCPGVRGGRAHDRPADDRRPQRDRLQRRRPAAGAAQPAAAGPLGGGVARLLRDHGHSRSCAAASSSASDAVENPRALVINEAMARREFPDQDPIGRRFSFGPGRQTASRSGPTSSAWSPTCGSTAPTRSRCRWPTACTPASPRAAQNLVVRTAGEPTAVAAALRAAAAGARRVAAGLAAAHARRGRRARRSRSAAST